MGKREEREITVAAILLADPDTEQVKAPEVSVSERRLHGDLAGTVQLLREASTRTHIAHVLACQLRKAHKIQEGDEINRVQTDALDQAVESTWKAQEETWLAFHDVAAVPPALFK